MSTKSNAGAAVVMSVKLPSDDRDALVALAALGDRTLSAEIRRAVRFYLEAENGAGERAA